MAEFKLFNTTLPSQVEDCHGVMQDVPGYIPDSAWERSTDQVRELLHRPFPHVTWLADTWDARRVRGILPVAEPRSIGMRGIEIGVGITGMAGTVLICHDLITFE